MQKETQLIAASAHGSFLGAIDRSVKEGMQPCFENERE
jgi:hypothetical protein